MTGNMIVMFVVGFIIFTLYLVGLLTMIVKAHKHQRRELENDPELKAYYEKLRDEDDYIDYDGHGNWGRFNPHNTDDDYYKHKKRRRKGKKVHVGKRMNYD